MKRSAEYIRLHGNKMKTKEVDVFCNFGARAPDGKAAAIWLCGRSRWLRGLRRGSAALRLLGLRVRIPPGASMSVVSVIF